ncbi:MAG: Coenzyme F420 hydrogenase/dehydrogenase, beta subunit C-terminal domain [Promethearchaeota archaeon]
MATKERMIDYLQSRIEGIGFRDLYDFVVNKDVCIFCATCASLCPRIGLEEKEPKLMEYDPTCSMCFRYCARTYFPEDEVEKEFFGDKTRENFLLGYYQKATTAKSTNEAVLKVAQNGGVVSTLLIHALQTGLIDGALVTGNAGNWVPKPYVARTPEEILAAAGSRYTMAPSMLPYSEAIYEYELEKLAFVGMPCQIQAARKLQLWPPLSDQLGKITLIIGLFCSSNFTMDLLKKTVYQELGVSLNDVKKFDISKGKFFIYLNDGSVKDLPIKETKVHNWASCQYCKDYAAEFADISVGSVGAPSDDWNTVFVRSEVGTKLWDSAVAAGKITVADTIELERVEKEALRKKSQLAKMDEKVYSAIQRLNVSDVAAKTYATLVSLGYANLSMLSKVMKIEEAEVKDALNALQERDWILKINGAYRPVNPTQVVKSEINKFEEGIKKVKSDALIDLENLYVQNNLRHVRYKEFMDLI